MKERPILFNGEMVKALLEGRKTQTRRIVKPRQLKEFNAAILLGECSNFLDNPKQPGDDEYLAGLCPHGAIRDILWVKESYWAYGFYMYTGRKTKTGKKQRKFIDCTDADHPVLFENPGAIAYNIDTGYHPRVSLFMPRIHSRIQLKITNIRVERVQDITKEDALAEGIERTDWAFSCEPYRNYEHHKMAAGHNKSDARCSFMTLWDSINAKKAPWKSSPLVWVIEFKVL